MKVNWTLIKALVRRDLGMYFTNPTGYVFITLFIFLSATAAFWQERFFANNLANLDQLNIFFPYLLLFFIPALTMGVWANENKQGTDELLLTLPATDFEIVLGKYIAAFGIYTASLVLSFSHVIVLMVLGSPDYGLMFGNYLGYWLIGGAMIAVGMLASLLTANVTIAFVLGALFCGFFVYIDAIGGALSDTLGGWLRPIGVVDHFEDFARGVISFSGVLYFLSLTGVMLYLNTILLGRRHWPLEADGYKMWVHHTARVVAVIIAVISLNAILDRFTPRLDVTSEQLHSLSDETEKLLSELDENRPVFIQAWISEDVPESYVQTRANLLSFLKEIDATGGNRVQVEVIATEPFTEEAREAREKFGIVPQEVIDPRSTRASTAQIFMGVAFTCGPEEEVIPFFDRGLPTEYELVRSIRVVAKTDRKKIGIVGTEAKLFGGFDFNTMRSNPPWSVVEELKKQYEVVSISASDSITQELDALLVALPSSLPQQELDNLKEYIERGTPTLLLVDPLLMINIGLSPSERAGSNRNPFMNRNSPPPKEKGNIQAFMQELGFDWNTAQVVWDYYNPHPDFAQLPPEFVFVGRGNGNPDSFNDSHVASAGLQELVLLYPGYVKKALGTPYEFTPLLKSSRESGTLFYQSLVQRSFFGVQLVSRGQRRIPNSLDYVFAAQIKGAVGSSDTTIAAPRKEVNIIAIADLDFISEQFFEIRKRGYGDLNFDNVTFFLNAMDLLAGDESFITLRKRRVRHRTLETIEGRIQAYIAQRAQDEKAAEAEAQAALNEAQQRLNDKVAQLRQRTDYDAQTKEIMARNLQEAENKRLETIKAHIEAEKQAKILASKERMEQQIRAIQNGIKTFAVLFPPIPVVILGLMIFARRRRREVEGAIAARRLRS